MLVSLPQLHRRFEQPGQYQRTGDYRLLPFRFARLDDDRYVLTNLAGQYQLANQADLHTLVNGQLASSSELYRQFHNRQFLLDDTSDVALDLLALKYRTRHARLAEFTSLHIFVITLRCEHSCPYCQVSRVSSDKSAYDMSSHAADRSVELMFQSPSRHLKVEFQGGEPLLNFEMVRYIVETVERRNQSETRNITFVIATNLALLNDEILAFCRDHHIQISTSLDGPRDLHNSNRPRPGHDSYERAIAGIQRCREALELDSVSALMTTTRASLECPEAIIDEYVTQGFRSIFLRWLSPFGFAVKTHSAIGYPTKEWNVFYERGLRHILKLNAEGIQFVEQFAALILTRMLTPYSTGYVDLQSPAGTGIAVAVYNYDGDVYASDEARMLAQSGDRTFRLGSVNDDYRSLFGSERLVEMIDTTMTEATPQCCDCAFEPYCGTDPVFHHATQGDMVGHRPTSAFCDRNMFVFKLLLRLLEDDPSSRSVLTRWIR